MKVGLLTCFSFLLPRRFQSLHRSISGQLRQIFLYFISTFFLCLLLLPLNYFLRDTLSLIWSFSKFLSRNVDFSLRNRFKWILLLFHINILRYVIRYSDAWISFIFCHINKTCLWHIFRLSFLLFFFSFLFNLHINLLKSFVSFSGIVGTIRE